MHPKCINVCTHVDVQSGLVWSCNVTVHICVLQQLQAVLNDEGVITDGVCTAKFSELIGVLSPVNH